MIHYMIAVQRQGGFTWIKTRCGIQIAEKNHDDALDQVTAWESDVTCDDCVLPRG